MKLHPGDTLLRAAAGQKGKVRDRILEHVADCPRCRIRLTELAPSYDLALDRAQRSFEQRQSALARERVEAPGLLTILSSLPTGRQVLLLRNSRRFQTWGLLELLIRTGQEETFRDTRHAEEILYVALEVSNSLDADYYGSAHLEDMRARIWGYIANARRVEGDLQEAASTFEAAFERLDWGTGDSMDRATLLDLKASLFREQRNFDESIAHSQTAVNLFRRLGERHQAGRCMVNQSLAYCLLDEPRNATRVLYQALALVDRNREPRVALAALSNLAGNLALIGQSLQAQRELARALPLYNRFSEPTLQARRLWVEAEVSKALGQLGKAEELLQKTSSWIFTSGTIYHKELLARDLATVRDHRGEAL